MTTIEATRLARGELRELIETRQLPAETRERVAAPLLPLEELPRPGKQLSEVWRDCRALVGPWGRLIVVYMYIEAEDRVVVIAFHDARTSDVAITGARRRPGRRGGARSGSK